MDEDGEAQPALERGPVRSYWIAILNRHGGSLRRVAIGYIYSSVRDWTTDFVEPLLSAAQTVEELILEVPWTRIDGDMADCHVWVSKCFVFLIWRVQSSSCGLWCRLERIARRMSHLT